MYTLLARSSAWATLANACIACYYLAKHSFVCSVDEDDEERGPWSKGGPGPNRLACNSDAQPLLEHVCIFMHVCS